MASKETPLAAMKRRYGSKDKLVDALVKKIENDEEDDGALKQRLLVASNKKLLRLADALEETGTTFGSKDKLVAALSEAQGKSKDADYVAKLGTYSHQRLLDMMRVAGRRNARN